MESSNAIRSEQASSAGGVKAMPAVRAMARKLRVDLSRVRGTGADGVVTMADVKQAAADGTAKAGAAAAGAAPVGAASAAKPATAAAPTRDAAQRTQLSEIGRASCRERVCQYV